MRHKFSLGLASVGAVAASWMISAAPAGATVVPDPQNCDVAGVVVHWEKVADHSTLAAGTKLDGDTEISVHVVNPSTCAVMVRPRFPAGYSDTHLGAQFLDVDSGQIRHVTYEHVAADAGGDVWVDFVGVDTPPSGTILPAGIVAALNNTSAEDWLLGVNPAAAYVYPEFDAVAQTDFDVLRGVLIQYVLEGFAALLAVVGLAFGVRYLVRFVRLAFSAS